MPRRPRPSSRRPPKNAAAPMKPALAPSPARVKSAKRKTKLQLDSEPESVSQSGSEGFFERDYGSSSSSPEHSDEDGVQVDLGRDEANSDAEPDAPRVAQWMDEEELDVLSEDDSESSDEEETMDKSRLEAGLKSLSFGALRKAQKALQRAQTVNESEDEEGLEELEVDEEPIVPLSRVDKGKEREDLTRQKKEVLKRKNKHAPMEVSSKRPVSRSRFVTEKVVPRDPRFLPMTGDFDAKRYQSQYGFLSDMHQEELSTLKENLKRARKLLVNSPRDLRSEREAEVERLERTVKRAESSVNKDQREKVEMGALSKAAKDERDKRKQGKKAWYMKDSDKKALLLRAKYDALAETGGRGAVRKAIEKKQKKVNQKEKKKIPFAAGRSSGAGNGQGGPTRNFKRFHSGDEGGPQKRPRPS